jgi:shikimate dehydrogenase
MAEALESGPVRCAVLGKPIAHSLSPVLHRAAYDVLGLEGWTYDAVEVDRVGLAEHLADLDDSWRGLSLTMPLKRAVVPLLDDIGPTAWAAGAVNTVLLGGGRRIGENTDVPGMVAALRERYDGPLNHAVVVGGGATAASALVALAELGCASTTVLVRDPARAGDALGVASRQGLAVEVGLLAGDPVDADLVVCTIPATAQDPALVGRFAAVPVVFEVVYDGWPTPLATAAAGRVLVSGLDLLVHQAVLQVGLMAGLDPDTAAPALPAMRAAGVAELAARG